MSGLQALGAALVTDTVGVSSPRFKSCPCAGAGAGNGVALHNAVSHERSPSLTARLAHLGSHLLSFEKPPIPTSFKIYFPPKLGHDVRNQRAGLAPLRQEMSSTRGYRPSLTAS